MAEGSTDRNLQNYERQGQGQSLFPGVEMSHTRRYRFKVRGEKANKSFKAFIYLEYRRCLE